MPNDHKNNLFLTVQIIRVTTVHSVQWNAGMGDTDTLHPNSCFCSFSIPTSKIFLNKIFVTTKNIAFLML